MPYALLRSELGLTWDDVMYNISYQNLIMLSKCTPNYSIDRKDDKKSSTPINRTSKTIKTEPPEFGQQGNIGGFQGLIKFFKGIKNK